jgi:hypothetical protein
MKHWMIWAVAIAGSALSLGCAGSGAHADGPSAHAQPPQPQPQPQPSEAADVQSAPPSAPAATRGDASPAATTSPAERPFAKSPLEAQSMIQEQIDTRVKVLWRCVDEYRAKKGDPHRQVVADIGIDQEGNLIGVTSPSAKKGGDLDPALRGCLTDGLRGLAFPRSHAGVITVRQTFKDAAVQP